jgi:hypothetical protein
MFRLKLLFGFLKGTKPSELLVKVIKGVAEGKFGEEAKAVYWAVEGYKTVIGLVGGLLIYILEQVVAAGYWPEAAPAIPVLYAIAAFLLSVGLYDGALRSEAPKKE